MLARFVPARKRQPIETIRIDRHDDLGAALYFVGPSPIFLLPPEMLTLQGARRLTNTHPFVAAIADGPGTLARFYAEFSPRNLAEMYRIPCRGLAGEQLAPWEIPWLRRERKAPPGEDGLGAECGVSYYGPCAPEKIAVEHRRLTSVAFSIAKKGYRPDRHGHIEGHFLQSGPEFRFFVRGGKHRAAALTSLGVDRIPVRVRLTWPRVVMAGTERDWPLVRSGEVSPEFAALVFRRYFHED